MEKTEIRRIDKAELLLLELNMINYLYRLVREDSESGYIANGDDGIGIQDAMYFLENWQKQVLCEMKKVFSV